MKIKIVIADEESTVLDEFHVEAASEGVNCLANEVRDYLGRRFNIVEDGE